MAFPRLPPLSDHLQLCRFLYGDTPPSGQIRLSRRNIYILPTREGLFFAVVLVLMLIGSINYSNSLGYLLTFLLGSLAVVTILHTYRNLYHLRISLGTIAPVFCGQKLQLPLILDNTAGPARHALRFDFPETPILAVHDVPAGCREFLILAVPTRRRGDQRLQHLRISCRFPLGLFQAWSILNFDRTALVYPHPRGNRRPACRPLAARPGEGAAGQGSDDFTGLRNYQPGDSLRHVHWKALAREQGLQTKQFGGENNCELWFDWHDLAGLETETRLSQLTRWIVDAHRNGVTWGLRLPQTELAPARGEAHRHHGLSLLARFGQVENAHG